MKMIFAIKSLNVVGGGAERVLVQVANGLAARGHELSIMTFDAPGESFYRLDGGISRIDLDVAPAGVPTPRLSLLRSLPRMRAAIVRGQPDVVVGFMHSVYVPLALSLIGTDYRVVASEHANASHFASRPIQRLAVDLLARRYALKTVPSDVVRRETRPGKLPVAVVPNPVDLMAFARGAAKYASLPVVLCVGRLSPEKNHSELLAAFARISADFPQWILRIAGDGELRPALERDVDRFGLAGRVEMPGIVADMPREYSRAAFVAMPSRYESFGLATAEALASSRAVLGFADCPGTNELVRDGENGLLVPGNGDRVASLAAGLARLMADRELRERLGKNGPASVAAFAEEEVVAEWERLLLSIARPPATDAATLERLRR